MWSELSGPLFLMVSLAVLSSASLSDARTRTASDVHWAVLGIVGISAHAIRTLDASAVSTSVSVAFGSAIILSYILSERMSGVRAIPPLALAAVLFTAQYMIDPGDPFSSAGLAIPVASFLVLSMYRIGMIRGGADAKALVVIAVSVPTYSEFPMLPLLWQPSIPGSLVMVPVFGILILALVMSLAPSLSMATRNIISGDVDRHMFSSYRMALSEAEGRFVWPLEDAVDGMVVECKVGDDPDARLDRLTSVGAETVRVTPMIPFIIPLTVSFFAVTVLGNPLFAITV